MAHEVLKQKWNWILVGTFIGSSIAWLWVLFFCCEQQPANVHRAASPAWEDVKAAVDLATPGQIVLVPPGTATWTNELYIEKNITLHGAGCGTNGTLIIDAVKKVQPEKALIRFITQAEGSMRLTGFHFMGSTTVTQETFNGRI